jgi:hypothetical protein
MSSPQDILLARGYCYLVQRTDCDERDYSDYSDRRNHDHLSILGSYSTLEKANRRAKAEARRFQLNMGRRSRRELDENDCHGDFYGATVLLRNGDIERVEFTVEKMKSQITFIHDGDDYGDESDENFDDDNYDEDEDEEVYGLDDNPVQPLAAPVPLAPAQAPANISSVQVAQPVQQAPQRRNTIAHVPTNASYPLVQIPTIPQSLTSFTLTLAESQSPLSKATLTYIIHQHGG